MGQTNEINNLAQIPIPKSNIYWLSEAQEQTHRGWYCAGTYERRPDFPSAGLYVVQVATQQGMESVRVIAAGR